MECTRKDMKELLLLYQERVLGPPDLERVEEHFRSCGDCREEMDLLQGIAAEPVPDPGEAFWMSLPGRVARAMEEEHCRRKQGMLWPFSRGFRLPRWAWAPAAAGVLVVLASILFVPRVQPPSVVAAAPVPDLFEEPFSQTDSFDVASLGDEDLKKADHWADRAMANMGSEAVTAPVNGSDDDLYEEIADLDTASLDRLSRMLDALQKEGRS